MYRVFLVDDRSLSRSALRALLTSTGRATVTGEAGDLAQAHDRLAGEQPDAILCDYASVADEVPAASPLVARLLLLNVPPMVRAGGFEGAAGWLGRHAAIEELVTAITAVAAGHRHVSTELSQPAAINGTALSRRELEVMRALAGGQTNREIASNLGISVKTIDTHRGHVLKKLNLRNNSDITRFALRFGYLKG